MLWNLKKAKRKKHNEETTVQGNIIMLMENAQDEAQKLNTKKVNINILFFAFTLDISPQTKLLLEKHRDITKNFSVFINQITKILMKILNT